MTDHKAVDSRAMDAALAVDIVETDAGKALMKLGGLAIALQHGKCTINTHMDLMEEITRLQNPIWDLIKSNLLASRAATDAAEHGDSWERQPTGIEMPYDLNRQTKALVVLFAQALAEKLYAAEQKYGYSDGWRDETWLDECREKLAEHVQKGDPRDVAAYCAFLWHHRSHTNIATDTGMAMDANVAQLMADEYQELMTHMDGGGDYFEFIYSKSADAITHQPASSGGEL